MHPARTILHVDMDAFFAAVEQRDDPSLRGKPVLVGGRGRRGVVTTASYEARPFGCRSAMPMAVALRLCPHAVVVPTRFGVYAEVSRQVFAILERFTDRVQPVSVDEAFLDVTGCERLFGDGPTIASKILDAIRAELHLTASVGVAPNKFLAKLASDLDKPDGLTLITPETLRTTLDPLPVGRVWGIGPKMAARLERLNIKTIGALIERPPEFFDKMFGSWGTRVRELIHGIDDRDVVADHDARSIGHEQTFGEDVADVELLRDTLLGQCEQVATRLRRHGLLAGAVQLKLRYGDFRTITRRSTLDAPTDSTEALWQATLRLFHAWADESLAPLRLIGMSSAQLTRERQLGLFNAGSDERARRVDEALDKINQKFGKRAVRRTPSKLDDD